MTTTLEKTETKVATDLKEIAIAKNWTVYQPIKNHAVR